MFIPPYNTATSNYRPTSSPGPSAKFSVNKGAAQPRFGTGRHETSLNSLYTEDVLNQLADRYKAMPKSIARAIKVNNLNAAFPNLSTPITDQLLTDISVWAKQRPESASSGSQSRSNIAPPASRQQLPGDNVKPKRRTPRSKEEIEAVLKLLPLLEGSLENKVEALNEIFPKSLPFQKHDIQNFECKLKQTQGDASQASSFDEAEAINSGFHGTQRHPMHSAPRDYIDLTSSDNTHTNESPSYTMPRIGDPARQVTMHGRSQFTAPAGQNYGHPPQGGSPASALANISTLPSSEALVSDVMDTIYKTKQFPHFKKFKPKDLTPLVQHRIQSHLIKSRETPDPFNEVEQHQLNQSVQIRDQYCNRAFEHQQNKIKEPDQPTRELKIEQLGQTISSEMDRIDDLIKLRTSLPPQFTVHTSHTSMQLDNSRPPQSFTPIMATPIHTTNVRTTALGDFGETFLPDNVNLNSGLLSHQPQNTRRKEPDSNWMGHTHNRQALLSQQASPRQPIEDIYDLQNDFPGLYDDTKTLHPNQTFDTTSTSAKPIIPAFPADTIQHLTSNSSGSPNWNAYSAYPANIATLPQNDLHLGGAKPTGFDLLVLAGERQQTHSTTSITPSFVTPTTPASQVVNPQYAPHYNLQRNARTGFPSGISPTEPVYESYNAAFSPQYPPTNRSSTGSVLGQSPTFSADLAPSPYTLPRNTKSQRPLSVTSNRPGSANTSQMRPPSSTSSRSYPINPTRPPYATSEVSAAESQQTGSGNLKRARSDSGSSMDTDDQDFLREAMEHYPDEEKELYDTLQKAERWRRNDNPRFDQDDVGYLNQLADESREKKNYRDAKKFARVARRIGTVIRKS